MYVCIVGLTPRTRAGDSLSQQLAVTLLIGSLHITCSTAGSPFEFAYGQKAITAGSKRTL